ncbi:MAG: DNA-3-methyladenine glycosylase I [Candidatus Dadabacteria bacterium]|nr:MAG: DNA-3-methyladenine glycosylase I [Candidatus Dadabacteria bacterium]
MAQMVSFAEIEAAAQARHPDVVARLATVRTPDELAAIPDDRWLSAIVRRIFEAGFVWRVIEQKWPGFEAVFAQFDPVRLAMADDHFYEQVLADARIIRNRQKVMAVADNAEFVLARSEQHGGFGRFVACWPCEDVVGLWKVFADEGARLGGNSAALVLRRLGYDTFILSDDVVHGLLRYGLIDRTPTGWRQKRQIQDIFLQWKQDTGRPLAHLSLTLACAVG